MPRPPLPLGSWGNIYIDSRGNGYRARARYRDYNGTVTTHSVTASTASAARNQLLVKLRDYQATRVVPNVDMSVYKICEIALAEDYKNEDISQQSYNTYLWRLENVVAELDSLSVEDARTSHLQHFLDSIDSVSNKKFARVLLRKGYSWALRNDLVARNYAQPLKIPRHKRNRTVATLSDEEIKLLFTAIKHYQDTGRPGFYRAWHLAYYFALSLATGARPSELLALRWKNIDFTTGTLTIAGTLIYDSSGKPSYQDHTKTQAGFRVLKLPQWCVDVLVKHRQKSIDLGFSQITDLLFPSSSGDFLRLANLRRTIREVVNGTPLEGKVFPYITRATATTRIANKLGLDNAAKQAGHSDTNVTNLHYVAKPAEAPDNTEALNDLTELIGNLL